MFWRLIPLIALMACTAPVVHWPAGPEPETPALLTMDQFGVGPAAVAEAQGKALAAQADALKIRAAAIGTE